MKKGWIKKELKFMSKIMYGHTAKSSVEIKGPKYLRITDIQNNIVDWNQVPNCPPLDDDYQKYKLEFGDIVFARTGATTGKSFLVKECPEAVFASYLIRVQINTNEISPEFLFMFFQSPVYWSVIESGISGSAQGGFNAEKLGTISIPIPSSSEQKKIVAILDSAFTAIDAAKANIEKNIENANNLFQSRLDEIFSQNGKGWEEKHIDEISTVVNGFSFKSGDFSTSNSVKSIKITNVGVKEFIESEDNKLPFSYSDLYSDVKVKSGDLVLALTRTIISNGLKVAKIPESYDGALLNQRVAAIVPDNKIIDSDFLYYYFCSQKVTEYVHSHVNTLMQPNLSITDLKKMPVPVCEIEEQLKITRLIDCMADSSACLLKLYSSRLANLEELKKSLLQKAFAGELT